MSKIGDEWGGIWAGLGKKSFGRFYNLTEEEVNKMLDNPNDTLFEMISTMQFSLDRYEDYMVKEKRQGRGEEELINRWDLIDFDL